MLMGTFSCRGHLRLSMMKNAIFVVFFTVLLHLSNAQDASGNKTSAPSALTTLVGAVKNAIVGNSNASTPVNATGNVTLPVHNSPKLICYYEKSSVNRSFKLLSGNNGSGEVKFSLADLNSSLCTHLVYSFISLDPATLKIKNDSLGPDFDQVIALKDKGIIVMASLGGRVDSEDSKKYSKMVQDGSARKAFIDNTVHFLRDHKLQGLDLNWDYPSCWRGDCQGGSPADKANFANLVRELRFAFTSYKLLLSVAVSPLDSIAEKAYNIPVIAQYADWVNLMTFDYNNLTFAATAIHSPFQGNPPSSVSTVEYYKSKGVPLNKLILGVPTFGRTFTLARELWNITGSPAAIGKPTQLNQPGLAAYFEICAGLDYQYLENVGPYGYKGDQWVSFDDLTSVNFKGEYVRKTGLGGALIYTLDMDDFSGAFCNQGPYPLLHALRKAVFSAGGDNKTA